MLRVAAENTIIIDRNVSESFFVVFQFRRSPGNRGLFSFVKKKQINIFDDKRDANVEWGY